MHQRGWSKREVMKEHRNKEGSCRNAEVLRKGNLWVLLCQDGREMTQKILSCKEREGLKEKEERAKLYDGMKDLQL